MTTSLLSVCMSRSAGDEAKGEEICQCLIVGYWRDELSSEAGAVGASASSAGGAAIASMSADKGGEAASDVGPSCEIIEPVAAAARENVVSGEMFPALAVAGVRVLKLSLALTLMLLPQVKTALIALEAHESERPMQATTMKDSRTCSTATCHC